MESMGEALFMEWAQSDLKSRRILLHYDHHIICYSTFKKLLSITGTHMRYEKGHKEATRRHIVETAAARFRRDGIDSVGLADLMSEAGLTHGGFYSHFASKEDLVREAVGEAAKHSRENFARRIEEGGLEAWIRGYMRTAHRDHPERGCIVATLAPELARRPKSTRTFFTKNLGKVGSAIESHLPDSLPAPLRRKTAIGIFATLVGALQMARVVNDPKLSDEILEAGITSALSLAQIKSTGS
jgi:TetR/AcrR family transcriptional repressor of nem operon